MLKLGRASRTIVVKEVRSPERLQEEISAVLSKDPGDEVADSDTASIEISLAGKKVLVVDDDIRNIFALTALLERQGMKVVAVDSGADALETVRETGDIDIALVDVMMPEIDGYTTMSMHRSRCVGLHRQACRQLTSCRHAALVAQPLSERRRAHQQVRDGVRVFGKVQ